MCVVVVVVDDVVALAPHHSCIEAAKDPNRSPRSPREPSRKLVPLDVLVRANQHPPARGQPHPHAAVLIDPEVVVEGGWA